MFDLLDRPLHWIPVRWKSLLTSTKKSGLSTAGEHEIELQVELVDRDEARKMFPVLFGDEETEPPEGFDVFKRVVKDWRKIKAGGKAVELSDENIRALLNVPCFEAGFAIAYVTALAGQAEVREGNSSGSPSGGREDTGKAATT